MSSGGLWGGALAQPQQQQTGVAQPAPRAVGPRGQSPMLPGRSRPPPRGQSMWGQPRVLPRPMPGGATPNQMMLNQLQRRGGLPTEVPAQVAAAPAPPQGMTTAGGGVMPGGQSIGGLLNALGLSSGAQPTMPSGVGVMGSSEAQPVGPGTGPGVDPRLAM